jgi:hypothetical protein
MIRRLDQTAALTIFMYGGRNASLAAFILVLMALGLDRPWV